MKARTDYYSHFRQVEVAGDSVESGNGVQINPAAAAANPNVKAVGDDTNVGLDITAKGTGGVTLWSGDKAREILKCVDAASAVNELTVTPAATGAAPELSATGGDTNIDVKLTPKGTGAVKTAAAVLSTGDTKGVGYGTGAGGTVTQATSITTGVTLNKICGEIITVSQTVAAGAEADFVVTNSAVAIDDVVVVCIKTHTSGGAFIAAVVAVAAGSFTVRLTNLHATAAGDNTLTLSFVVIKAVKA